MPDRTPESRPVRRLLLLLLGLSASLLIIRPACAQGMAEQLRKPFWMQGRQIRKTFAKAVEEQRTWTVTLFSEKEAVAVGAIVSSDGWIVTKASQLGTSSLCQFSDGRRLPFEYVGFDVKLDLALLKVDAENLPSVQWETEDPKIGSWMISTSSNSLPVGVGVMSVPRRRIPRSDVRGVLGIQLMTSRDDAVIDVVFPNSGAEAAGLTSGDRVRQVNQTSIRSRRHLVETIGEYRPGDTVVLQVIRKGDPLSFSATLTHPFGDFLSRIAFQEQMGGPLSFRRDDFEAVYQHDTVLRPEECGGPVVNLNGKAVGINIARAGRTATYALPADLILSRLEELKTGDFPPPRVEAATVEASQTDDAETEDAE